MKTLSTRLYILLLAMLAGGLQTVSASVRGPLTFEDRVKAQEAIERVYYAHRIWPKENPQPKPPFEQMVPKAVIEAKVTDYLKKCNAVEKYWQRPIQPEQLQAEMDRMAKGTKDPATLRELFVALGNDPNLIAECLARPVLTDRLINNWYAYDDRFHGAVRQEAQDALATLGDASFKTSMVGECSRTLYRVREVSPKGPEGSAQNPVDVVPIDLDESQFQVILGKAPALGKSTISETRDYVALVRTLAVEKDSLETESLVFKKRAFAEWWAEANVDIATRIEGLTESGGPNYQIPDCRQEAGGCEDAWQDSILGDFIEPRYAHTAVWTGTEMIVWGGLNFVSYFDNGGRYNPATDTWEGVSGGSNRLDHTAVWTGTEMIVWGGYNGNIDVNTGERYNPLTGTWTATSTGTNCPSGRIGHTAVWTGTEMIIWGGSWTNTGGRYNPLTDIWTATSIGTNCPSARYWHTAVWTGSEMVVWGGDGGNNTGGRYTPASDTWVATSTGTNCPSARYYHTAVWTGTELIVWGGYNNGPSFNTGGRYNPSTDIWAATSTGANCPSARVYHTAIWSGTKMIIWGGGSDANTGGQYNPSTNAWTVTSTGINCPLARNWHTAVWTGTEMIIWGGCDNSAGAPLNTGGRYDPSTDGWLPTAVLSPCANWEASACWTGTEAILWGGYDGTTYLADGARYDPVLNTATPTSTLAPFPLARYMHTAIWTGTRMVIWGGYRYGYLNSGGQYDPIGDVWTATSTAVGCPTPRQNHSAVWTGTRMIVWGGYDGTMANLNTGGRYDPNGDSWLATSTGTNCPLGRSGFTAVWTGTEMIVWGGIEGGGVLYDGGRYNPTTDAWTATSTGDNYPWPRYYHTAIWSGTEMIVWGGTQGGSGLSNGGRYNPSTDSWAGTSTGQNCPSGRYQHTAIWTGEEMIVWGGTNSMTSLGDGARLNPVTDAWSPVPNGANTPTRRYNHSALWTGTYMLVWGGSPYRQTGGLYQPPPAVSPVIQGASSGCQGQAVNLSTGNYTSYQWTQNGADIPNATAQAYGATVTGTYAVRVTDTNGCSGTSSGHAVTIYPLPAPTISGPSPPCSSGNLYTQGEFSSYQWYQDGSPILGATGPLYWAPVPGSYTVVVVDTNRCSGTSAAFAIIANPAPVITGPSSACTSAVLSTTVFSYYQWWLNGNPIAGANGQVYTALASGTYSVQVANNSGCTGTSAGKVVNITTCVPNVHYDTSLDPNTTLVQICGDGDSVVEPGEVWAVTVRLVNTGTANATNTVATLSVDAGSAVSATVTGNPGSFGTIAQGGGTATATYQFHVSSGATCGTNLTFDVTGIQSTEGSYPSQVPVFSVPVGTSTTQNETGNQQTTPLDATSNAVTSNFTPAFTLPAPANWATVCYSYSYTPPSVTTTLFSDEFNLAPSSNGWTVAGTVTSIATTPTDTCTGGGGNYANLANAGASMARVVSTTGKTNITVVLDYRYTLMNTGLGITVDYSTSGTGGPWTTQWSKLATGSAQSTTWGNDCGRTIVFPTSCENNASFALRIRSTGGAGSTVKADHLKVTGQSQVGSWTGNVKVELVNPGNTVTVLKDYGAADGSPYNVKPYYTGAGTYKIQLTENAGGTAALSSGSMVVNGTVIHCAVSSCGASGGPPPVGSGKSGTTPARFTKDVGTANQIDVTYDATHCSGPEAVILYGNLGNFSGYAGCAQSNAGNTGTATIDGTSLTNVWFNIVWTSGTTAGNPGYGFNGTADIQRTWTAAGRCGMTADDRSHSTCP